MKVLPTIGAGLVLASGVFAAAAPSLELPRNIVQLPPFVVHSVPDSPWRYVEAPGFEVLSRASDAQTRGFAERQVRAMQLFRLLVPERLQARFSEPHLLILTTSSIAPSNYRDLLGLGTAAAGAAPPSEFLSDLFLRDRDGAATFATLEDGASNYLDIGFSRTYVRYLLEQRTPQLPAWFVEGLVFLYQTLEQDARALVLNPFLWRAPPELLPMEDMLALPLRGDRPVASTGPEDDVAQAALFIRWAVSGATEATRDGLWRYVERASTEPATEALFTECFGASYAQVRARLKAYLPFGATRVARITAAPAPSPGLAPRRASETEVLRIKAEWERLAASYVAARQPAFAAQYEALARSTLKDALAAEPANPRLLASAGLFEIDRGNDPAARAHLESAPLASLRPRAALELARLRLAALAPRPGTRIDPAPLATVLQPLEAASRKAPLLPEIYTLASDALFKGAARPTRAQVDWIEGGLQAFPRDARLHWTIAAMELAHGYPAEALGVAKRGLALDPDAETRARLDKLVASIQSSPAQP